MQVPPSAEQHGLPPRLFAEVNRSRTERGLKLGTGTIVDATILHATILHATILHATILHAPSSAKNKAGIRDPEMHQVRKGNQWYFGMKAHIGIDSQTRLIHSVAATAATAAKRGGRAHAAGAAAWKRA